MRTCGFAAIVSFRVQAKACNINLILCPLGHFGYLFNRVFLSFFLLLFSFYLCLAIKDRKKIEDYKNISIYIYDFRFFASKKIFWCFIKYQKPLIIDFELYHHNLQLYISLNSYTHFLKVFTHALKVYWTLKIA